MTDPDEDALNHIGLMHVVWLSWQNQDHWFCYSCLMGHWCWCCGLCVEEENDG